MPDIDIPISGGKRGKLNNVFVNDQLLTPIVDFCVKCRVSDIYITIGEEVKVKKGETYSLKSIVEELLKTKPDINKAGFSFQTKITENDYNNILKCIFPVADDLEAYNNEMNAVGEFDYAIGFDFNGTCLRLRLNFVTNINGTTLTIRPLLSDVPSYQVLTSLSWATNKKIRNSATGEEEDNKYLTEEIVRQINNMSHVGRFLLSDFQRSKGLIVVTGKTGDGKSTLTTSYLNELINQRTQTIITIEDPVEYIFDPDKKTDNVIIQIEIPSHVKSFDKAIKASKRQNPDIVYIQEVRDMESAHAVLDLLSAGHLVIATLHTGSIVETFDRLKSLIGVDRIEDAKNLIANQLLCVVNQKLLRFKHNGEQKTYGIQEYLHVTGEIRKYIR